VCCAIRGVVQIPLALSTALQMLDLRSLRVAIGCKVHPVNDCGATECRVISLCLALPIYDHPLKRERDAEQPTLLAHVVEEGTVLVFHVEDAIAKRRANGLVPLIADVS